MPNIIARSCASTTPSPFISSGPLPPQFPNNKAKSAAVTTPSLFRSPGIEEANDELDELDATDGLYVSAKSIPKDSSSQSKAECSG